eukprot:m51a1_g1753 putative cytosolic endo-beta-n-acetylglucosaminidase-like (576) ;mRNA; r:227318-229330
MEERYRPFKTVDEVLAWSPGSPGAPPRGPSVPLRHVAPASPARPRLLVCHDMMGGYLAHDASARGEGITGTPFHLRRWQLVDAFVYFSHARATVPPPSWTCAAHRHGVPVLGTFITEWDEGARELAKALADPQRVARQLAAVAAHYGFDGWLVNVENRVEHVAALHELVRALAQATRAAVGAHSLVVWYDSVTHPDGRLAWQDRLTPKNEPWFSACDGLFTNYTWKAGMPAESARMAGSRCYDVYTGIDVFGRNTYGGGGFECHRALNEIAGSTSVALFAPGWTYEELGAERFAENSERFWGPFARHFAPHALVFDNPATLRTSFDLGYGPRLYLGGAVASEQPWVDLSLQGPLPTHLEESARSTRASVRCELLTDAPAYHGSTVLSLHGSLDEPGAFSEYEVFTAITIPVREPFVVWVAHRPVAGTACLHVVLLLQTYERVVLQLEPSGAGSQRRGPWTLTEHRGLALPRGSSVIGVSFRVSSPPDVAVGAFRVDVGCLEIGEPCTTPCSCAKVGAAAEGAGLVSWEGHCTCGSCSYAVLKGGAVVGRTLNEAYQLGCPDCSSVSVCCVKPGPV